MSPLYQPPIGTFIDELDLPTWRFFIRPRYIIWTYDPLKPFIFSFFFFKNSNYFFLLLIFIFFSFFLDRCDIIYCKNRSLGRVIEILYLIRRICHSRFVILLYYNAFFDSFFFVVVTPYASKYNSSRTLNFFKSRVHDKYAFKNYGNNLIYMRCPKTLITCEYFFLIFCICLPVVFLFVHVAESGPLTT